MIEEEHLEKGGFGREVSGAEQYLRGILDAIKAANDEEDRLIPVHVDGDGHCLVHAISRCLVGRELFWHALRTNMRDHLVSNLDRYQASLQDFVSGIEWEEVVAEADAEYRPAYGEAHGLGNIHIFALANVLRRPIILLDGTEGMQSSGDYSATFLPCLYKPEECQGKKEGGELNSPIVIAWSSHGRNHFVPLVAVKSRAPALLPKSLLPDVWGGFDQEMLREYVTFDEQDRCAIGTGKALSESYIQKLIHAMQGLFYEMNEVSSSLVCDVQEQVLKNRGLTHLQIEDVIQITKLAVAEKRLNKCLDCTFLTEHSEVDEDMLLPGGELYEIAKDRFGHLEHKMELSFPYHGIAASYDKNKDRLHVLSQDMSCRWCPNDSLRLVTADGSTQYQNGDRTTTPTSAPSKCCGFKHFWEGKEYNNLPQVLPIRMEWQGETKEARVYWFEGESDPSLNSNAYQLASDAVNKHFPGEFGSERLVQQVVNMILKLTRKKGTHQQLEHQQFEPKKRSETEPGASDAAVSSPPPMMTTPTKIILIGEKHKTLHKEELTMSSKEREVKRRIEQNAPVMQSSKSGGQAKKPALQSDMKAMKVSKKEASPEAKGEATHKRSGSQEKRLRITSSDGRTVQMTFPSSVTFQQLDAAIRQQFDIPTGKIRIRYGFPPKELHVGDNPDDPLPLQHGEKVSVEIPEESQAKQRKTDSEEEKEPLVASGKRLDAPSRETRAVTKQLGKVLMMIVAEAIRAGEDVWSTVELMPELFEESGFFYEKVRSDLPLFKHGLHCTLAGMKEKTFAVNLKVRPRRLDLCLGKKHLKIGIGANQEESQCSEGEEEGMVGTLSGAVKRKEAGEGTEAFSGTGHSLRDPEEEVSSCVVGLFASSCGEWKARACSGCFCISDSVTQTDSQ